jgi:hypothetical protein
MTQYWTPTLNGVTGANASGSYNALTDADGATVYHVEFFYEAPLSALSPLAATAPATNLLIEGLPMMIGGAVNSGVQFAGSLSHLDGVTGFSEQVSVVGWPGQQFLSFPVIAAGAVTAFLETSALMPAPAPPVRGEKNNFTIAGSITFQG